MVSRLNTTATVVSRGRGAAGAEPLGWGWGWGGTAGGVGGIGGAATPGAPGVLWPCPCPWYPRPELPPPEGESGPPRPN